MRRDFKILHLVLFFLLKDTSKLLVRDLIYINQLHFNHIKLIVSLHLSQVN